MKKLKWWFLIAGACYLLLALMNKYFVLIDPSAISGTTECPFPATPDTVQAFIDGWSAFAFEILAIIVSGAWAARAAEAQAV
jgi:hypothetical protein